MSLPDQLRPALPSGPFRLREAILSSSVEQMLPTIESALQRIMPPDYAAIAFRDAQAGGHFRRENSLLNSKQPLHESQCYLLEKRRPDGCLLTKNPY
jgi:hypothetical protein